jgi:hypothetical protein
MSPKPGTPLVSIDSLDPALLPSGNQELVTLLRPLGWQMHLLAGCLLQLVLLVAAVPGNAERAPFGPVVRDSAAEKGGLQMFCPVRPA